MELFNTLDDFLRSCPDNGVNFEIQSAFLKAWSKIHGWNDDGKPWTMYPVVLTAISGGADSDVTMDMIERIGHPLSEVHYVFEDSKPFKPRPYAGCNVKTPTLFDDVRPSSRAYAQVATCFIWGTGRR